MTIFIKSAYSLMTESVCLCSLHSIDILQYIIYGLAVGFFVFGVLLLVEGFFTTGAIRDLYGEFKITACGRCLTAFVRNLCNQ